MSKLLTCSITKCPDCGCTDKPVERMGCWTCQGCSVILEYKEGSKDE